MFDFRSCQKEIHYIRQKAFSFLFVATLTSFWILYRVAGDFRPRIDAILFLWQIKVMSLRCCFYNVVLPFRATVELSSVYAIQTHTIDRPEILPSPESVQLCDGVIQ